MLATSPVFWWASASDFAGASQVFIDYVVSEENRLGARRRRLHFGGQTRVQAKIVPFTDTIITSFSDGDEEGEVFTSIESSTECKIEAVSKKRQMQRLLNLTMINHRSVQHLVTLIASWGDNPRFNNENSSLLHLPVITLFSSLTTWTYPTVPWTRTNGYEERKSLFWDVKSHQWPHCSHRHKHVSLVS